jgi:L-arabinose isomerase
MDQPPKVGVLLTLADLYRKSMPGISEDYTRYWRNILGELFANSSSLHFPATAHTSDEVAGGVRSCEQAGCDLLLVLPMAYAPSGAAVEALCATNLPILVVSTARDATLGDRITHEDLRANQAMHGVQDLANLLRRLRRRFVLLAGHPDQDRFRRRLERACRAAIGAEALRGSRVGRLGIPFEGMLDFSYSPALLAETIGFEVVELKPELLVEQAGSVDPGEVEEYVDWAQSTFEIDSGLTEEEFSTAAAWSLALEEIVDEHGLGGIAMNFQAVLAAGAATLPFLGANRLMSRGIGYAGEGDVLTAALNRTLHCVCGEATFTETFAPDYERGEILLSHMGECNPALADPGRPIVLKAKPFSIGKCTRPAVPVFQLKPGVVTLASLSELPVGPDGAAAGFQLVVFRGEIVAAEEQPELISPYSRLRIAGDLAGFLEAYSKAGGTHHLALGYGDIVETLSELAAFADLHFYMIGG